MDPIFSLKLTWKVGTIRLWWKKVMSGKQHLRLSIVCIND
jgi:hypothetical protein